MPIIGQISVGDGATFTPAVDSDGVISWSNNKNLPNPASVDIPQAVVDRYQLAPVNSPAFTGTPTAPTPEADDDSAKIATTGYVQAELEDYATLNDLSTELAGYLPLSGGTMAGAINMGGSALNMGNSNADNGRLYTISNVLRVTGGKDTSSGSYVDLGTPSATNQGIKLTAKNTTNETSLLTTPDGGLLWNGVKIGLQNGTYDISFYSFGYLTSSGTSLDLSFPFIVNGKNVSFNSLSATLRSYKGYLSPGGVGGSDILTGSTQGTWYKKDACPCMFRLVRSGGWGTNGENNTLVVGELTANITVSNT